MNQDDGAPRSERRADPESGVDGKIDMSADAGWNQLIHRGVNGGILTADAAAGESAEESNAPKSPGKRGSGCGCQVESQSQGKNLTSSHLVCGIAEDERSADSPNKIRCAAEADLRIGKPESVRVFQDAD